MKALILAGGFGTRLQPELGDEVPKCMAPIKGKPIIEYIIEELRAQGIQDITLSLHHKAESFIEYFGKTVKYHIEDMPLGTGGAIKDWIEGDDPVLVLNGDTISAVHYDNMLEKHTSSLTIAVTEKGESAGAYIINSDIFDHIDENCFSLEKDVIPYVSFSLYQIPWFVDIGTPESYKKAKNGIE